MQSCMQSCAPEAFGQARCGKHGGGKDQSLIDMHINQAETPMDKADPAAAMAGAAPGLALPRRSLHDLIVPRIRTMILSGDLPPTATISEVDLSRLFGVSRTPLREALKVLAAEGLVILRAHRSPVVAGVDATAIAAIFETIAPLEALAGRLATERADEAGRGGLAEMHNRMAGLKQAGDRMGYFHLNRDFHLQFARLAGNPVLHATLSDLLGKTMRARASANLDLARWEQATVEHGEIMAAFVARRPEQVAALLLEHSQRTATAVLGTLTAGSRWQ